MANLDTPATRGLGDKIVDAASNGKDWLVNTISGNDATASAEAATNSASSVVDANNLTAIFDQIKMLLMIVSFLRIRKFNMVHY